MGELVEYVPGAIWLSLYPVRYGGMDLSARMSVVRLSGARLMLHSPCEIDAAMKQAISALGEVAFIVAPGNFHHLHVESAQAAFPDAETWICPGVERKRPEVAFDWFLADRPPECWRDEIDQVLVRGSRFIWEVAFYHRPSRTLLLVDVIENIGDRTPDVHWLLKFWWKAVFRMWNRPGPAPEYRLGWKDKAAAAKSLRRILAWDFERIVLAHGDNIDGDARAAAREAWKPLVGEG